MSSQDAGHAYDELASRYDGHHVDAKSLAENRYIAQYLRQHIHPRDRVVDLGCGTGLFLELVPTAPERYVGTDISDGMLGRARQKFPAHRFLKGDMQQAHPELPGGSADFVISLFGSPSYCDLGKVEAEITRLLRPGGRFFLMFCSPLYVHRETYITRSSNLLIPYTERDVRAVLRPDVVWGMSRVVDRLPKWTPSWLMNPLLRLECATLGRTRQDDCYFINAYGHR